MRYWQAEKCQAPGCQLDHYLVCDLDGLMVGCLTGFEDEWEFVAIFPDGRGSMVLKLTRKYTLLEAQQECLASLLHSGWALAQLRPV